MARFAMQVTYAVVVLFHSYIKQHVPDYSKYVVVAKNAGASKRAALIAKRLKLEFGMIFGEQTKFAECLSEEAIYDGDGSLDAVSDSARRLFSMAFGQRCAFCT